MMSAPLLVRSNTPTSKSAPSLMNTQLHTHAISHFQSPTKINKVTSNVIQEEVNYVDEERSFNRAEKAI